MEKLLASDPEYAELNRLQTMYCILVNRQIANRYGNREQDFVAGVHCENDGDAEIEATKRVVYNEIDKRLDTLQKNELEGVWGEFVDGLFEGEI